MRSTRTEHARETLESVLVDLGLGGVDSRVPLVAVVGGSGLGGLSEGMEVWAEVPFSNLFPSKNSAISGHAMKWIIGSLGGVPLHFLSGRKHGYEGIEQSEVVAGVQLLAHVGAKLVVLTNAAGGVHPTLHAGDLMLIRDQINLMFRNPLIGSNDAAQGPRFPDMSQPWSEAAGAMLRRAASQEKIDLKEGVYCAVTGPSYETPSEARMLRQMGAHAVGMSTVPENIAAVHAGLMVAGLSVITNSHVHKSPNERTTHAEVLETSTRAQKQLIALLTRALPKLKLLAGSPANNRP